MEARDGVAISEFNPEQCALCDLAEKHLVDFVRGRDNPMSRRTAVV